MFDWLIQNGTILDGTGAPGYVGDVAITNGRIATVARTLPDEAVKTSAHVLNAAGLVVAPGFIDIHRHADAAVFRSGFGGAELRQGITTIINGNCGLSIAPCPPARQDEFMRYLGPITGPLPPEVNTATFGGYMACLSATPLPLNVGMLVGSGSLRAFAAGFAAPTLSPEATKTLHQRLENALFAGAFGVSVGLGYLPDARYTPKTLAQALAPMAGLGIPLTAHVRGEGALLVESVEEMLEAARLLDVPLQIGHFKCIGKAGWKKLVPRAIGAIEKARAAGQKVCCDVYPWTAGSTQLACLLPPSFLQDGFAGAAQLLQNPEKRAECRAILEKPASDFENIALLIGWENVHVAPAGKSVAQIAEERGCDAYDAAFDLLVENGGDVSMVDEIACEEDIETILKLPYSSVISDAVYPVGAPLHPRNFATAPRVIEDYVNKRGVLSLPEAVHKMTGAPAQALGFRSRGFLKPGKAADVVVFNPETLHSEANYQNPQQFCTGLRLVLVNGEAALENDALTGAAAGRALRR